METSLFVLNVDVIGYSPQNSSGKITSDISIAVSFALSSIYLAFNSKPAYFTPNTSSHN